MVVSSPRASDRNSRAIPCHNIRIAMSFATHPRFSLVIPAWNEEKYLPRLLETVDIARQRYRGNVDHIEVIVADNVSSDATAEIARKHSCRVVPVEKRLIAAVRNGGAREARGEILCFTDADGRIHPETFNEIDDVMKSGRYVAGASGVRMERWSLGIVATWCVMVPMVVIMRMDTGVVFCRRDDFIAIGGYDENRHFAEDVQFLLDMRRLGRSRGQKLVRLRKSKVIASTRKFDKHGDWHYFTQMFRLAWRIFFDPAHANDFVRKYWYEDER
jgi:glycosyltransferase involved in cell wall biosynthesis